MKSLLWRSIVNSDKDTYRFTEMDRLMIKLTRMGDDAYVIKIISQYRIYDFNLIPVRILKEIAVIFRKRYEELEEKKHVRRKS